ncbi:DUF3592 domain-containing protein [Hymenobacter perfusus]|uniref:DUF3592 domain-containing protein n=1 Tax=Hymenobacter perfusus TaxID=1236770 RepID=A0A428K9Y8_9BACT|nr:DUF3592 domain-containing protein [Hymenobacter perfusus]RSK43286.1 DUF3592 domain-containing protein [Hymenobacter perfusus]
MTIPVIPEDLLFALICLLLGGLFLRKANRLHQKHQHMLIHSLSATATIVRLEDNPSTDHRTYFPVLRFQTATQETVTVCYPHSKRRYQFRVGEPLQIQYNPATPTEILVPSYNQSDITIYRWLGRAAG